MNPEAQARLNEILKKDPSVLTEEEVAFLKARRGYLKQAQREEFKSVLEPNLPKKVETVKQDAKSPKTK